ncbi:Spore maturation protein A-like protein [Paramagnetospirillum magnetotacticum MS-1]|uniref:Spore maturation protein A-like protein n=1 Tax=Paramagnetospirillum magnetotacticum MS-1 TaxID=272627 RepID=A0A0C2YZ50_PARME|nr:nucleoside recognition domain-containing protein [Paramagnetospirillum magnetotacticum]KIL99940.1 Spore maturation protein A-like protein [Paramagnetospirillum magnetotacticum MS-1]
MNAVFLILVLVSFLVAAFTELSGGAGAMEALSAGLVDAVAGAVPLALGLVGIMALFLGLMKVAEAGGLLDAMARLLEPLLRRLFPEIPPGHPAMGAMVMNVAANLLGLGNAATPFGIRAMEHLESLNRDKGTASNAQVLFLGLNTAGLTLLPTKVIALRAATGSAEPAAIVAPTLVAGLVAALVGVLAARGLQGVWQPRLIEAEPDHAAPGPLWPCLLALAGLLAASAALLVWGKILGPWILPGLVVGLLLFGAVRGVRLYESFVEGAREGFQVAVRIIPYLVAILAAIGMVRASGAMDLLIRPLGRLTEGLGLPAEALMMAVMRTLSGSGSYGMLAVSLKDPAIGPDSYLGVLLSTLYGSTETTFYVLAVYFGAVQVRRIRHALAVGLLADLAALVTAIVVCRLLFGGA